MLNIVFWIAFGFLAGWIGTILTSSSHRDARMPPVLAAGMAGGLMGGVSVQLLTSGSLTDASSPLSLFGATVLAGITVFIAMLLLHKPTSHY